ncbi:MAG: YajQ family cyclic di-GMP-binding protein [Bacteroidetes bacterium]|nr:YajQ family cyclic di-GMP-binding protein [Bacteroidota bacterium]
MPSFDIASKVDLQTLDNAVNIAKKEVENRYDFKGAHVSIELNKKDMVINLEVDSEMQLRQLEDILVTKSMRQGLEANAFDLTKQFAASGKYIRKAVPVKNGIDKDMSKKIVKLIKDSGLKVQAAIMDDIIRVTGKKIDDLQDVIQLCRSSNLDLPLQFVNMKS